MSIWTIWAWSAIVGILVVWTWLFIWTIVAGIKKYKNFKEFLIIFIAVTIMIALGWQPWISKLLPLL